MRNSPDQVRCGSRERKSSVLLLFEVLALFSFVGFKLVEFLEVSVRIGFEPSQALATTKTYRTVRVPRLFVHVRYNLARLQVLT